MDVSETILANSEQVNADDLMAGPVTVTITSVEEGTKEQPVFIHLAEFEGRTFRPAKTVRRLIVAAWGPKSENYVGRKLTIYNDPAVKWGGVEVGGVRVSHMSHIPEPLTVALTTARGKRSPFVVQPLIIATPPELEAALKKATTIPELQTAWQSIITAGVSGDRRLVALKELRKAELTTGVQGADDE